LNEPLHILLVSYEFPPEMATGGIGSYIYHLAHLLHTNGQQVTVFSATNNHEEVVIIERTDCVNYLIPAANTKDFRKKVLEVFETYIQTHTVDVIESPEVGACALEIKKVFPFIPLVVKMHTPGVLITKVSNTYQPLMLKLRYIAGSLKKGKIDLGYWAKHDENQLNDPEYQICEKADAILSPSHTLKKWAIDYWKIPSEKITVIPNPFTASADLFQYPVERTTKQICFIGKLTVLKGMIAFTKAMKKVLNVHTDYTLVLAGRDEIDPHTGNSMQEWMQEEFKLFSDRVFFKGAITGNEVKFLLSQSMICVVPSLWENYPTVVLEAMAAGCAVAASNRGGIPELITDHENGILFNPLKPASIFSAVHELILDETLRSRLAAKGRKKVQEENTAKQLTEKILSVYQSVIMQSKIQTQLA
jgi:glycogen synthase